MRRGLVAIAGVIVVCSTVAGCGASTTASSPRDSGTTGGQAAAGTPAWQGQQSAVTANKVAIRNAGYEPRLIEVQRGQSVTWTNDDDVAHSVTATKGGFDLSLKRGRSGKHRFNKAGKVDYYCRIHPANLWMSGVVVVTSPAQLNP